MGTDSKAQVVDNPQHLYNQHAMAQMRDMHLHYQQQQMQQAQQAQQQRQLQNGMLQTPSLNWPPYAATDGARQPHLQQSSLSMADQARLAAFSQQQQQQQQQPHDQYPVSVSRSQSAVNLLPEHSRALSTSPVRAHSVPNELDQLPLPSPMQRPASVVHHSPLQRHQPLPPGLPRPSPAALMQPSPSISRTQHEIATGELRKIPSGSGIGIARFTQYASAFNDALGAGGSRAAAEAMYHQYFEDNAVIRHVLQDKTTGFSSTYDIPVCIMPRFVTILRSAGAQECFGSFSGVSEHMLVSLDDRKTYLLEVGQAYWTTMYSNGTQVICTGDVWCKFIRVPQPDSNGALSHVLRIEQLQYTTKLLSHTVMRSLAAVPLPPASVGVERSPKAKQYRRQPSKDSTQHLPPIIGSSVGGYPPDLIAWLATALTVSAMEEIYVDALVNKTDPSYFLSRFERSSPKIQQTNSPGSFINGSTPNSELATLSPLQIQMPNGVMHHSASHFGMQT